MGHFFPNGPYSVRALGNCRSILHGPVDRYFPEPSDDPWLEILNDATPRPALARWMKEVQKEIAQGKAKPLDLNQL